MAIIVTTYYCVFLTNNASLSEAHLTEAVVQGSIPYVPYLRAPYYVWVGHVPQLATVLAENKVEAPPMFPPTFLYTQSWEDPRPDMEVSPYR